MNKQMMMKEKQKKKKMTRIEIKEAVSEIKRCYGIGKDVLRECTAVSAPGEIEKLAAEHGVNRDKAQKLRAMAAKETGYTVAELKSFAHASAGEKVCRGPLGHEALKTYCF